jgi:hypothetical protein
VEAFYGLTEKCGDVSCKPGCSEEGKAEAAKCGGPGSGVPGPCSGEGGGEGQSEEAEDVDGDSEALGVPEEASDATVATYDALTEYSQDLDTKLNEAVDNFDPEEDEASDAIQDIYNAHDDQLANAEQSIGEATEAVLNSIYESYHPGDDGDPDHVSDFEGDWSSHEEEFRKSAKVAADAFTNEITEARDRAEECILTMDDPDEPVTAWEAANAKVRETQAKVDAAAEKWMESFEAATAVLVKNIAGMYGNQKSTAGVAA